MIGSDDHMHDQHVTVGWLSSSTWKKEDTTPRPASMWRDDDDELSHVERIATHHCAFSIAQHIITSTRKRR